MSETKVEPSREQVEEKAIEMRDQTLKGQSIKFPMQFWMRAAHYHLTKLHLETSVLKQALAVVTGDLQHCQGEHEKLQQQLTAAKAEIEQVKSERNRQGVLIRSEFFAKVEAQHARILELESKCGLKDEALNHALEVSACPEQHGRFLTKGDRDILRKALTTGNTLVERVKGLETLAELGNSISTEVAAYGECHCENYTKHGGKCPYCESVEFTEKYKAFNPTKATDE